MQSIKNKEYCHVASGKVFSKCLSKDSVKSHLSQLSGRKHLVYGGMCVIDNSGNVHKKLVKSEVYFDYHFVLRTQY